MNHLTSFQSINHVAVYRTCIADSWVHVYVFSKQSKNFQNFHKSKTYDLHGTLLAFYSCILKSLSQKLKKILTEEDNFSPYPNT